MDQSGIATSVAFAKLCTLLVAKGLISSREAEIIRQSALPASEGTHDAVAAIWARIEARGDPE